MLPLTHAAGCPARGHQRILPKIEMNARVDRSNGCPLSGREICFSGAGQDVAGGCFGCFEGSFNSPLSPPGNIAGHGSPPVAICCAPRGIVEWIGGDGQSHLLARKVL